MVLTLIIAILGVAFLFLYFSKDLEKEHFLLRLLSIFIFIILIVVVAKSTLDPKCEIVLNNTQETYQYGDNYTGYHWDYLSPEPQASDVNLFHKNITNNYSTVCVENNSNTNIVFYKSVLYFVYIFVAYIMIYFFYAILLFKGIIKKKKKKNA